MDIFKDKIAIITGAASGIGRSLGLELSRQGAKLIMADHNPALLLEAVEAVKKSGGAAHSVCLDVADFGEVKKMVDDTIAEHGRLDYLFNNAGVIVFGEARFYEYSDWTRVINTNLYGAVNGIAAAYPIMVRQGFGHIVNTASAAGIIPMPASVSYTASKYGIVGLSHSLRVEARDLGVRVSVACPGMIETPIYDTSKMVKADRLKFISLLRKTGPCSADHCAKVILRGVQKNQATIPITAFPRVFGILQRLSPSLVRLILGNSIKQFRGLYWAA